MKRDFLKELLKDFNVSDDVISQIMAENGKDINDTKAKFADYEDLKNNLTEANKRIESFGDIDAVKASVEQWKSDYKKLQEETQSKIAQMELQAKVKDFTGSKKFVNDFTKDTINSMLEKALNEESSKGKSLEDLFADITKDKANILAAEDNAPKPPVIGSMKSESNDLSAINAARAVMHLPPKN